jgi:hypothetical protein
VLESLVRAASVATSVLVVLSFVLFAIDESSHASAQSAQAVAGLDAAGAPDPSSGQEHAREAAHSRARETIDDANDVLVKPFAWTVRGVSSTWAGRGVPTALALLVYGLGLSYLARFAHGRV